MGAGVLPVSLYRGTILILLGQERSNNLWCDFGGSHNKNEKPFDTAIREGVEELNGLLGDNKKLKKLVSNNNILTIRNNNDKYISYLFSIKYDENIENYFNNLNEFAELHLSDKVNNHHNGLFEKKAVKWYSINDFKNTNTNNRKLLRSHYLNIVDSIYNNRKLIKEELNKQLKNN